MYLLFVAHGWKLVFWWWLYIVEGATKHNRKCVFFFIFLLINKRSYTVFSSSPNIKYSSGKRENRFFRSRLVISLLATNLFPFCVTEFSSFFFLRNTLRFFECSELLENAINIFIQFTHLHSNTIPCPTIDPISEAIHSISVSGNVRGR